MTAEQVTEVRRPTRLPYRITPGLAQSRFLRGVAERRIIGERCPSCGKVYAPSRGGCVICAVPTEEGVDLPGTGVMTTFCVVNIPFTGQTVEIPYVCATILLDGADATIFHLVQEVPVEEARQGMRVEPVWVDDGDLGPTLESIRYFRPTGEPDAPFESFKDHL